MLGLIIILWSLFGLFLFVILLYIINETNFLYSEPSEYVEPDLSRLMHKDAGPMYKIEGNKDAVMLIHGFTGTPYQLRKYAQRLDKEGFDIIMPLQPGAGTSKEDFKKTYFSQWYKCNKDKYIKYRPKYDKFFVLGLSMGGAMTLKLAEEFNSGELLPTAVITIAAPVFLNSLIENGILYSPKLYLSRIGSWITDEMPERFPPVERDNATDTVAYDGTFPKQTQSLKMGIKSVKASLSKIKIPIFLSHSKGDKTVPFENIYYISRKVSSKQIKMKIYDIREFGHSQHVLTVYNSTKEDLYKEIISFIKYNINKNY